MNISNLRWGANFQIIGKADPQKLSHQGAWKATEGSLQDLAAHIGKGHPWMPALLDGNGKRWQSNANYAQIFALDIDEGMSIPEAVQHPFISAYSGAGIESASSTAEHNKFRLIFVNPSPINTGFDSYQPWQIIRICNQYLASQVGAADPACKDASRFFYGAPGRSPFLLNEAARLPEDWIDQAMLWHQEQEAIAQQIAERERQRWAAYRSEHSQDDADELILSALDCISPDCDYLDWLAIGMTLYGLGGNWLSAWDRWSAGGSKYKPGICEQKWRGFKQCEPRLGHLFNLAKAGGFKFPKQLERPQGPNQAAYDAYLEQEHQQEQSIEAEDRHSILERIKQLYNRSAAKYFKRFGKLPENPKPNPANPEQIFEYEEGDRRPNWQSIAEQGYRYILDSSPPGTGKSFDSGNFDPAAFGARQAIYLSDQHRNPTVDTLEADNGWIDLEARHNGLSREKTADGGSRLRRAKKGEAYSIAPNCNRTRLISALRNKNIAGADTAALICGGCPLKEACAHAEGPGYGFLNQRQSGLSSPKLRAHPDSLPSPDDYDFGEIALLWDEPSQNFEIKRDVIIGLNDLQQAIATLMKQPELFEKLQPLLIMLLNYFDGSAKTGRYGLNHHELIEALPLPSINPAALEAAIKPDLSLLNPTSEHGIDLSDLPPSLRRKFIDRDAETAEQVEEAVLKQWLPELLQILSGQISGASIRLHRKALTLSLPDSRHRAIAQQAKINIFLDATLTREDLALKLGCSPDEIFVCRQKIPETPNLSLIQVSDLGRLGMQRGDNQQARAGAIAQHYRSIDPSTQLMDFLKFHADADAAHWRDGRGVNFFINCKMLIIAGTPCPNLAELQAQYSILIGSYPNQEDEGFQAFVDRIIRAELHQEIGRLRAHRRLDEQLQIILLTDFNLGLPVQRRKASEITPDAADRKEIFQNAVKGAIAQLKSEGKKITQSAVARLTNYSQQHISRNWNLLLSLLENPYSKRSRNFEQLEPSLAEAYRQVLGAIASERDIGQALEGLGEIFFDWISPSQWHPLWESLPSGIQSRLLSLLAGTLPEQYLFQLAEEAQ